MRILSVEEKREATDIVPLEDLANLTVRDLTSENGIIKALTTDQVFEVIKNSVKVNSKDQLQFMLQSCQQLKDNLELTGQSNLLYQLTTRVKDIGREYKIIEAGYKFYVYRKDINTIIEKVNKEKGFKYLKLDRLSEYMRLIPPDAAKMINETKELFAEMYILHIDPSGNHEQVKEQTKKDRDPIVFGLTSNKSEKMYFIASWEDAWCDYTLTELLDDMGQKLGDREKVFEVDIPTTVDELVTALSETTGLWNEKYGTISIQSSMYANSSTSTSNITQYRFIDGTNS